MEEERPMGTGSSRWGVAKDTLWHVLASMFQWNKRQVEKFRIGTFKRIPGNSGF
jgi:hypothetical protein